jgi:aminopeptidase
MVDTRVEKLAKLCVKYSVAIKPKEKVLIRGSDLAYPLINEVYKECLLRDAYPLLLPRLDVDYTLYKFAKNHQLRSSFARSVYKSIYRKIDAEITVLCNPNPKSLTGVDPAKVAFRHGAWKDFMDLWTKRQASGELRWTLLPYPINADAQEASMALHEYEDFVYRSCLVDRENPVREWKRIHANQEEICKCLSKVDEIRITGEDTDLTFSVKGRKWMNCDGKLNMPDGEVFTGPVENSANGTIRFSYPGIYAGREVEDVSLAFKDGKVIEAKAAKGNELLQEILKIEGATRIGEAAIGTNYGITRFTKNMLFDEKMGGTIHMALGDSYPQCGGLNKSAVHWDILKDMKKSGEIHADGKLIYTKGKFLI